MKNLFKIIKINKQFKKKILKKNNKLSEIVYFLNHFYLIYGNFSL